MAEFIPIKGDRARRYINPLSGEIISVRQYQNRFLRGGKTYTVAKKEKAGIPIIPRKPAKPKQQIIKPPPIVQKRIEGPRGSEQITTTRFADITDRLNKLPDDRHVYFRFWDNRKGDWVYMYKKGGVRVDTLKERMAGAKATGEAKTDRDALLLVFRDDIAAMSGDEKAESPSGLQIPQVFTQMSMHVLSTSKAA